MSDKIYLVVDRAVEDSDYTAFVWYKIKKDNTIEVVKTRLIKPKPDREGV